MSGKGVEGRRGGCAGWKGYMMRSTLPVSPVTPALRPRDHPEVGSTLGKDPEQPAQPAARISKGPVSFFLPFFLSLRAWRSFEAVR